MELILDSYNCVHDDLKAGADAETTLHVHRATHLLNDELANAQPKASTFPVYFLCRLQLSKLEEKLVDIFGRYASTLILDLNGEARRTINVVDVFVADSFLAVTHVRHLRVQSLGHVFVGVSEQHV